MATIKSYTSLEQSRKLAEILPIESADMCFNISQRSNMPPLMTPYSKFKEFFGMDKTPDFLIPCWSLAALIEVLPLIEGFKPVIDLDINQILYEGKYRDELNVNSENLIDACYEMIIRLHELKML